MTTNCHHHVKGAYRVGNTRRNRRPRLATVPQNGGNAMSELPEAEVEAMPTMLRVAALGLEFITEPETIRVYTEWARKAHEKANPACDRPECMFRSSPQEWHRNMQIIKLRLVQLAELHGQVFGDE